MNSSVEKNYRNSTRIVCDLLTVTQDSGQNGIAVTVLCQKGNDSFCKQTGFFCRFIYLVFPKYFLRGDNMVYGGICKIV